MNKYKHVGNTTERDSILCKWLPFVIEPRCIVEEEAEEAEGQYNPI